ncbi:hypothetical protein MMC29_002465 [Sticta canariensis]|nr:hypothetical protein [Sticta canariensis]
MGVTFSPSLTPSDAIVLRDLTQDIEEKQGLGSRARSLPPSKENNNRGTVESLGSLNNIHHPDFQPTVFTGWDQADISESIDRVIIRPYAAWAEAVVRRPTDVVFLTHIIIYLCTSVPSAILLVVGFSWPHAALHWLMQAWYSGAFTLMLHNHIHNNGILAKKYSWFDRVWPYILGPLMGHTWDSYYYHHVKHHHVENNGPGDLSSTLRYQRDELLHFLCYVGRFMAFVWLELPLYFLRKNNPSLAIRTAISEFSSYALIYLLARHNLRAAIFVLIIPLLQLRVALMVGNWGQHALVDELEPDSDFRSSITLIDVARGIAHLSALELKHCITSDAQPLTQLVRLKSNRYCFNDGYHTSHHLNPRRHWRDHPLAFIKAKPQYRDGRALVFQNIDYIMITVTLLRKDYMHLAACLVPIGDQMNMSQTEIADLLRTKTKKFSEDDIRKRYGRVR